MKVILGCLVVVFLFLLLIDENIIVPFLGILLFAVLMYIAWGNSGNTKKIDVVVNPYNTLVNNRLRNVPTNLPVNFDNYTLKLNSSFLNKNIAVIDFETATKQRSSAIQLGVTTVKNGVINSQEWFFKPYRTNFDKEFMFTYLHGITPAMVIDKPMFHELWHEIEKEIEGCVIVAHNASFDLSILDYMHQKQLKTKKPIYRYLCTLELARKFLKNETSRFSLEVICKELKLPYGNHDGKKDTLSCLYVLNRILNYHTRLNTNHDNILKGKIWRDWPIQETTSLN